MAIWRGCCVSNNTHWLVFSLQTYSCKERHPEHDFLRKGGHTDVREISRSYFWQHFPLHRVVASRHDTRIAQFPAVKTYETSHDVSCLHANVGNIYRYIFIGRNGKKDTGNYSTQLNFFILGFNELNSEVSGICFSTHNLSCVFVLIYSTHCFAVFSSNCGHSGFSLRAYWNLTAATSSPSRSLESSRFHVALCVWGNK